MDWVTWVGYGAAFCTTASFLPQAIKIIRTRDISAISFSMYFIFTLGLVLWLIFGIVNRSVPIILANSITLLFSSVILYYTWRYK